MKNFMSKFACGSFLMLLVPFAQAGGFSAVNDSLKNTENLYFSQETCDINILDIIGEVKSIIKSAEILNDFYSDKMVKRLQGQVDRVKAKWKERWSCSEGVSNFVINYIDVVKSTLKKTIDVMSFYVKEFKKAGIEKSEETRGYLKAYELFCELYAVLS